MGDVGLTSAQMVVQYGFAGFSILLLGILIWLLKRFIELQKRTIDALNENTATTRDVKQEVQALHSTNSDLRNKLHSRPCIARQE